MRKLTKAEVLALQPSNTVYHVKLTRLYYPTAKLIWEGDTELYVQRAAKYRNDPEHLATVTPKAPINWAEGGDGCVEDDGSVVVEDYQMEIFYL